MGDRGNEDAGASFYDQEAEGPFSLDRREVVVGLAAGAVLATTPVSAANDSTAPDIRLVRNPEKHDEIGVALDFGQGADAVAIVFYARNMAASGRPETFVGGKHALDKLDRFAFDNVAFSKGRGIYRLEFSVAIFEGEWKASASFSRKGHRNQAASINSAKLAEFCKGKAELQFNLNLEQAELFRWDLFGERLEVKGNGAQLSLKLSSLAPPRGSPSPWNEAQLRFSLVPRLESTIWAIKGTVSINKLKIRQTRGDQGDGSRIQEKQEFEKLKNDKSYRADAWIGEAVELAWLFPPVVPAATAGSNTVLRPVPEEYRIVDLDETRLKPVIAITHDAPPNKLTLRQWGGNARATVAALRVPLKVTILSPRELGKAGPPAAVFHLADALLTRQDIGKSPKPPTGPGDVPDEQIAETLSGRLREQAFAVETVYGTFIVEGDPPPRQEDQLKTSGDKSGSTKSKAIEQKSGAAPSGAAPQAAAPPANAQTARPDQADPPKYAFGEKLDRPSDFADRPEKGLTQFQLRALGGDIFFFDARALLRQICVALPDAIPRPATDKPVGWSNREAAGWSRLDFDGSEIAFRIDLPEDPKNPETSRYRRAWPSARGVVTLCEMPRGLHDLSTIAKAEAKSASARTSQEPKGTSKEPKRAEPKLERPAPVVIALDGARLLARRDSDNFALTFQFARMALELGLNGGRIVANAELSGGGAGQAAKTHDPARKFDDRPLLIVNFPPQHVAEMAYYRQINDGLSLPDVLGHLRQDEKFAKDLNEWRAALPGGDKDDKRRALFDTQRPLATGEQEANPQATEEEKAAMRGFQEIAALTKDGGSKVDWQNKLNLDPAIFEVLWNDWVALPLDQRQYYLGPSAGAMDPDVRKILLTAWRAYRARNPDIARPGNDEEKAESIFQELLARLPDVDLSADVENDIEQRLSALDGNADPKRPDGRKDATVDRTERIIKEKKKRSYDFFLVSEKYAAPADVAPRPANLPAKYSGRDEIRKIWKTSKDSRGAITKFVRSVADRYEADAFGEKETFRAITPARLSGPSRLVFRFDPAGGSVDDPDREKRSSFGEDREQVRSIHFSFEGLTDWGHFDLAVVRRAETLELQPSGRVPHASMRALDLDPQRILLHQGIQPGRSIDGRMRDILASLQPPGQNETAIELPFRLVLSPDQFGRFRTRRTIEPGVVRETKPNPDRDEQLAELWTANLQIGAAKPVVRAIWSDDFLPGALDGGSSPARGPHAPWDVPAKGVAGASQFRTALDAYDRHEIVALGSVYGLPAMGRRNELNNLIDGSQFEPPKSYKLDGLKPYKIVGGREDDLSGIYNPSALNISELRLTALGGSLRHDTTFIPPASAIRLGEKKEENIFEAFTIEKWRQITVLGRDIEVEVVYKGFLFPLGVRATLVKLTERRFVRAAKDGPVTAFLIQRKFVRIGKKTKEFPAVGEPDKGFRFPVSELTMLTLETPDIVDPDILDTQAMTAASDKAVPGFAKLGFRVRPNGTIDFSRDHASNALANFLPGLCFWPRVRPSEAGNIYFEFRVENDATPVRMPMIFVDNRAANNQDVMTALTAYYNGTIRTGKGSRDNLTLRTVRMGGASRRYADENKDGECHFETFSWEVRGEGRAGKREGDLTDAPNAYFASDPLLQGSDQPPFYPYIHRGRIRVGQAERFIGRPLEPQWVRFNDDYRRGGFKDIERYLEIVDELDKSKDEEDKIFLKIDMGEAGDRSGGIGRPAMNVKFLSRRYGLLPSGDFVPKSADGAPGQPASDPQPTPADLTEPPPPPKFDLTSFFNGDAKLLGLLTFKELLEAIAGSAMPELKEQVDAATEQTAGFLKQTVLPQVERSLKSLEQMWETAQRKLSSQAAAAGDVVRLDINQIYPDIAPALKSLLGKVKQAETASGLGLVGAMSEVQTSGRKFVTAVSRTLADPVTPLREDLRSQFRQISIQISNFGAGLPALMRSALDGVAKDLVQSFKKEIADKLSTPAEIEKIKPFTRLVLSLPVPKTLNQSLSDADKTELAKRLDRALAKGAIQLAVTVMESETLAEDKLNAALVGAIEAAKNDLQEAAADSQVVKDAIVAYRKQAEDFIAEVKSAADEAKQQIIRRVKGAFYPELFETIGLIPELKRQFESLMREIKEANGRDILENVARHVGATIRALLTELVLSEAKGLCDKIVNDIAKLADQVLMPATATADRADIGKLEKTVLDFVSAFPADAQEANKLKKQYDERAKPAIDRYKEIRGRLTEAGLQDVCNTAPERSAIAVHLAGELNELMALKEIVGQWVVAALKLCEQSLTDKVKRAELNKQQVFKDLLKPFFSDPKEAVAALTEQLTGFVGATDQVRTAWSSVVKAVGEVPAASLAIKDALDVFKREAEPFPDVLQKVKEVIDLAEKQDPLDAMRIVIVAFDGVKDRTSDELYNRISLEERKQLDAFAFIFDPNERARGIIKIADDADRKLQSLLGRALTTVADTRKALIETIGRAAAPIFVALNTSIYQNVKTLRDDAKRALAPGQEQNKSTLQQIVARLLKVLKGPNGQALQDLFAVPDANGNDRLELDLARVDRLANFPKTGTDADLDTYVADLAALADDWTKGTAAPLTLLSNLRALLAAVLKGDLAQFVDLHLIRQQVDQAIRTMVPARVNRSFDLKIKVKDLGKLVLFEGKESNAKALGLPKQHPKGLPQTLVLRATGVVDFLKPENSGFDAEGYLPGFALQLLPSFDVVTFSFPPTTFTAGLGKPFHVSLKVEDVKLGEKVKFLQDIQSILPAPKSGKGFFIRMLKGRGSLGIVAGYALPISPITIGNMFIDQLSLNIAAELPFDKGDARFIMSVSRPEAPFTIAVAPYAGAGHFGLIANPKGIVGFEASFQFGGGGGFSFGPLTGKGRISVGVFVRKIEGLTELYGTFYVGGSARIACFAVGAELYVRLSHQDGDMTGEAIFTFTFSIGIKDIEYSVTVYKRESGSSGKSESSLDNGKTIDLAADEFREVYAQATPGTPVAGTSLKCARIINATLCKAEDYDVYRSYFSHPGTVRTPPTRAKPAKPSPPTQSKGKAKQGGAAAAPKFKPSGKVSAWVMK